MRAPRTLAATRSTQDDAGASDYASAMAPASKVMDLGSVWLFSALGEPVLRIRSPTGPWTTNCAYGGPDNRTLYITESKSGSVLTAPMPVPGRRMFSHL